MGHTVVRRANLSSETPSCCRQFSPRQSALGVSVPSKCPHPYCRGSCRGVGSCFCLSLSFPPALPPTG